MTISQLITARIDELRQERTSIRDQFDAWMTEVVLSSDRFLIIEDDIYGKTLILAKNKNRIRPNHAAQLSQNSDGGHYIRIGLYLGSILTKGMSSSYCTKTIAQLDQLTEAVAVYICEQDELDQRRAKKAAESDAERALIKAGKHHLFTADGNYHEGLADLHGNYRGPRGIAGEMLGIRQACAV